MAQVTDVFRVARAHTPLGGKLVFRELQGREELSRAFDYRLELVAEQDAGVDPKAMLGRGVTVEVRTQGGGSRYIDAHCTRFGYIGHETVRVRNTRLYRYEARLRPWTWYMTLQSHCRVFQNQSVPDIVRAVLGKYDFPVDWRTSRSYRSWEYCVQYQETDFNFVSRLLEHEGIYYYFEHAMGSHTLVLCDDLGAHGSLPGYAKIPHIFTDQYATPNEEWIDHLQMWQDVATGTFETDDYDFKLPQPHLRVFELKERPHPHGSYNLYDWPGGYWNPDHGSQYARIRLEELQQGQEMVSAQSNARGLTPGYLFTLERCPRRDQNREYLIVAVNLNLRDNPYRSGIGEPASWQFTFTAQPSNVPYRPARLTPKPRTMGPQTAVVVGEEGKDEEIVCDEHGRVRVQFHWDHDHTYNEQSSCWIRVSSGWAGSNWGQITIPRVNQEVIVDFLNGDPDYPIITGRVYNGEHKPPYALPRWKEYSTWKSRSTKQGGDHDFNEIRFYDHKGKEQVFIHSQRRMDIRVKGSEYHTVGGSRHDLIGWTATDGTKGGDHYHTVNRNCEWHTKTDHVWKTEGTLDETVVKESKVLYQAKVAQVVRGTLSMSADEIVLEGAQKISLKVGGSAIVLDRSGITIGGTMVKINSGGFGADASPANTKNPYDAYGADTGEPGYLDRPRRGWGPRTRTFNDGSVNHAVATPRPGEDPRMTAIRNNLANTPEGRRVLESWERTGSGVTFSTTQATEYNPTTNTINVNPNQGNNVTGFAHETGHAEARTEGRSPNVNTMSRQDYIRAQLAEDAHSERMAYESETANGSTTGQHNTITRTTYMNAYNAERARIQAAEPNASPEDIERRSHDAAESRLLQDYLNGRVTTGNTNPPQTYVDYWGQDWDRNHPGASSGTP